MTDLAEVVEKVRAVFAETYDFANLLTRAATDPGAAFEPEAVEALARLRADDPAEFQRTRAALKKLFVKVGDLDQLVAKATGSDGEFEPDPSITERLIEIATSEAELFHAPDRRAFADLRIDGRRETWPLRSQSFKIWLCGQLWARYQSAAGGEAVNSALLVLEAKALSEGEERPVFVRVAAHDGAIYLDLGNKAWSAVRITAEGWQIVPEPPVRFRRAAGMLPLPMPTRGGSLRPLRRFLNLETGHAFRLVVVWLLAVLYGQGPMPVLVLTGEQGSAKSTLMRLLRRLFDPNTCPLRSIPREERDLFIAAMNGWVICLDNLSGLPPWLSDALCKLSTGGGFAVRQLYTDGDEVLFDALRPAILNGISDVVSRPDLADRALSLSLRPIPEERRKTEEELLAAFDAACPAILGALLDGVAAGLRELPRTQLERLPRMADFARFAVACERGLGWREGSFMKAYEGMRADLVADVLDGDAVAVAVRALIEDEGTFSGTVGALLERLGGLAGDEARRHKTWPRNPRALTGRLKRLAPFLRRPQGDEAGKVRRHVEMTWEGHGRSGSRISLRAVDQKMGEEPSQPSHRHEGTEKTRPNSGLGPSGPGDGTVANRHTDRHGDGPTVTPKLDRHPTVTGAQKQNTREINGFAGDGDGVTVVTVKNAPSGSAAKDMRIPGPRRVQI